MKPRRRTRRKVYANRKGGKFQLGTIVVPFAGATSDQPGIVIRILSPVGDGVLGHRAWVAFALPTTYRRYSVERGGGFWKPEVSAKRASEAAGKCQVHYYLLDHLTPIGQAKRVPKCEVLEAPNALQQVVEGRWNCS